jgi:hypothetical protein
MVSGPLRFFRDTSPITMRPIMRRVSSDTSQVRTNTFHNPSRGPYARSPFPAAPRHKRRCVRPSGGHPSLTCGHHCQFQCRPARARPRQVARHRRHRPGRSPDQLRNCWPSTTGVSPTFSTRSPLRRPARKRPRLSWQNVAQNRPGQGPTMPMRNNCGVHIVGTVCSTRASDHLAVTLPGPVATVR